METLKYVAILLDNIENRGLIYKYASDSIEDLKEYLISHAQQLKEMHSQYAKIELFDASDYEENKENDSYFTILECDYVELDLENIEYSVDRFMYMTLAGYNYEGTTEELYLWDNCAFRLIIESKTYPGAAFMKKLPNLAMINELLRRYAKDDSNNSFLNENDEEFEVRVEKIVNMDIIGIGIDWPIISKVISKNEFRALDYREFDEIIKAGNDRVDILGDNEGFFSMFESTFDQFMLEEETRQCDLLEKRKYIN